DACRRGAAAQELLGAREARGDLLDHAAVAAPVAAHRVAVAVVPLRPAGGEGAEAVAALAEVPGLGDQLDLGEHRILVDGLEKGRIFLERRVRAGERGGEVEAKAV